MTSAPTLPLRFRLRCLASFCHLGSGAAHTVVIVQSGLASQMRLRRSAPPEVSGTVAETFYILHLQHTALWKARAAMSDRQFMTYF